MPDWLTIMIAVVTTIGGRELLAAWLTQRARRKVTEAEAAKTLSEADLTKATASDLTLKGAFQLMDKLRSRQDELDKQVCTQGRQIGRLQSALNQYAERVTYLMHGIALLFQQISDAGKEPCWTPDDWKPPQGEDT